LGWLQLISWLHFRIDVCAEKAPTSRYRSSHNLALTKLANADRAAKKQ
jgi:hypothetical protein